LGLAAEVISSRATHLVRECLRVGTQANVLPAV
jgi:hypothetical protein